MYVCLLLILSNKLDLNQETRFTILRWKYLPGTTALAYYKTFVNYGCKKFLTFGPGLQHNLHLVHLCLLCLPNSGANVITLFSFVTDK